jgi:hypothetical protein
MCHNMEGCHINECRINEVIRLYKKKFAAHLPLQWAQAPQHMEPQILQIPAAANTCPKYSLKKGRPRHSGTFLSLPYCITKRACTRVRYFPSESNIFLRICTYTQTITISNAHSCPPIAWHVPTHAIQIAPMYSKNCVMCITRLHQVLVGSDK